MTTKLTKIKSTTKKLKKKNLLVNKIKNVRET